MIYKNIFILKKKYLGRTGVAIATPSLEQVRPWLKRTTQKTILQKIRVIFVVSRWRCLLQAMQCFLESIDFVFFSSNHIFPQAAQHTLLFP
jgi:hypothetical protein